MSLQLLQVETVTRQGFRPEGCTLTRVDVVAGVEVVAGLPAKLL